ncbi:hypothetical protein TNCV_3445031 [Trichonephila clavipes]|nr:hypothetical protein TNCV_3445031 [Trichonephila clavipes]
MPSGPGDFERFKSPMASSNVCIEKAPPNKDHSPSCSGDRLWIPNYATACAVEDPPRKAKPLRFDIFELQETKLPVRLIKTTNERILVQGHENPLRVKRDIEDVSSELDNGG